MTRSLIALLCATSAAADYVVDWRVPQDNDANANAWVADVTVPVGEKVVLEWTDYFAFHNVYRMKDKAAYDACDFDGAVELAPSAATGSVTIEATETTTYYACEIGDGFHCDNGQKLSVTGSDDDVTGRDDDGDDEGAQKNIVETAQSNADLSTLVEAVVAADLVDTLSGEGPFTVFAPTNAAFAALPEGTLESLLEPENKQELQKILTYHVVQGKVLSTDLTDGDVPTVEGGTVKVMTDPITINGANVIFANLVASNGVVHLIDAVLMPDDHMGDGDHGDGHGDGDMPGHGCVMSEDNFISRGVDCSKYAKATPGSWESCSADCLANPACIGLQTDSPWDDCEMVLEESVEDCPTEGGGFTFYPKDCGDGDHGDGHGDGDMPGHGDGGHDHGHDHGGGGHGGDAECAFDAPDSLPEGPCQASSTYPLYCTAAAAEDASPMNGHHMMAGLFMPNGVSPMCHGNYKGDANECECEGVTASPTPTDESDAARAVSCAGAAALALAATLLW